MQEHCAREYNLHTDAAYHIERAAEARQVRDVIETQAAEIERLRETLSSVEARVLSALDEKARSDGGGNATVPVTARLVATDYWSGSDRPYRGVFHDRNTDERLDVWKTLHQLLESAGVTDGDEVEITVCKTGERPFGDRRVRLVAPHTYEREKANGDPR